jgi:aldehyde:ferredoxin oxidoreductase
VAFAIECFENNLITKKDTDGIELSWGNSKAIVELVKRIIEREGIGDILADGSKIASEKIAKGSEKYAITSLGSELPMHSPKFIYSLGFSYAYDPTPGRHTTASIDYIEVGPYDEFETKIEFPKKRKKDYKMKIKSQVIATGFYQILCSSGLCMMATQYGYYPFLDLINALTGWKMDIDECVKSGLRIQTLRQAFTLREGIEIAKNVLPGRTIGDPPDERGPTKGVEVEYKDFYKDYCKEMGWNPENGYPLEKTLKNLDLDFVLKDLY